MDWMAGKAGRLRVEELGGGPGAPVVLVHGGGGDRSHWHAVAPLLATDRRVVLFDQRGHGESDAPTDGDLSLDALASDVAAVAFAFGLQAPVLVGHSLGGAVVAETVGRLPNRFAGAVFLDSAGDIRKLPAAELAEWRASTAPDRFRASSRAWFEHILSGARPETRQHVLSTLGLTSRETYVGTMEAILRFDPAVVRRFTGPTLLLTVRELDSPLALRASLPDLPNAYLDECSHWPHLDQPERVAELVRGLLGQVDLARPRATA